MSSLDIICPYIDRDKERFKILWKSLQKFLDIADYRLFLVSPSGAKPVQSKNIIAIKETDLFPLFSNKKFDNFGWWKQQLIKLSAHKICSSEAILSVDCDCFLNKQFSYIDIVEKSKIKINLARGGSYINWYSGSSNILKLPFKFDSNKTINVTPFVFSKKILVALDNYLTLLYNKNYYEELINYLRINDKNNIWTEYCLYHIYAHTTGMIEEYHYQDDDYLFYGNSVWYEKDAELWYPVKSFNNPKHWFTVVQSTSNKSVSWVENQIKDYLKK